MKHLYGIALFTALLLLTGCQKSINEEDEGSSSAGGVTTGITTAEKSAALTIAQAQLAAKGTPICVKGYIVAATERSIHNATFTAPFQGTSALVLASKQSNGTNYQFDDADLFPICLTDAAKNIRNFYNLQDNPEYWNQYVYITGTKEDYLSLPGLKKVKAIEIDASHIPDAETDSGEDPDDGNGEDPEDDGPGDNGNDTGGSDTGGSDTGGSEPTTDDGGQQSSNVLTVAEAKRLSSNTKNITVQGYIVAATGYDMQSCIFLPPFDEQYNTYLVLADKPCNTSLTVSEQYDLTNFTDLFPVHLGSKSKSLWKDYNLQEHPQLHNKLLRLKGTVIFQLGTIGMYEVDVSEVKIFNDK